MPIKRSLILLMATLAACTAPASGSTPTVPTTSAPPVAETTMSEPEGLSEPEDVTIEVRGWVIEDHRGPLICPWESGEGCPGLELAGDVPELGSQVALTGRYDGQELVVESANRWIPEEYAALPNPCTGNTNRVQPPEEVFEALDAEFGGEEFPPGVAQTWVSDGQIVVGFIDDGNDLADRLRAIDGVCVDIGYSSTTHETGDLMMEAMSYTTDRGVVGLSGSADGRTGEALVQVDAVSMEILDDVFGHYGPAVRVERFITVVDDPLDVLPEPVPAVPGEIDLPTDPGRKNFGMSALFGAATLRYDPDLRCVYVGDAGLRITIVWPFGYTATVEPLIIYDAAGTPVLVEGQPFEMGGGQVGVNGFDAPHLTEHELRGADELFLANGGPRPVSG